MTEMPDHPAHDRQVARGAQAAVDATFNAHTRGEADDIESRLRAELADAGVEDVPDEWIADTVDRIRRGEPVVVEPDESPPPE
jgi:hypothetical protein